MGWKISTTIINSNKEINDFALLSKLGYKGFKLLGNSTFEECCSPEDGQIYIGRYKDKIILCENKLAIDSLCESTSIREKLISMEFPNTEICSIVLQSTVNLWGFSVCKNEKRIRAKAGSLIGGTKLDFGEPFNQELDYLNLSKIDNSGNRIYNINGNEYEEDQVGEELVFNLTKRYFKKGIDQENDLFFNTVFRGYSFSELPSTSNLSQIKFIATEGVLKGEPIWMIHQLEEEENTFVVMSENTEKYIHSNGEVDFRPISFNEVLKQIPTLMDFVNYVVKNPDKEVLLQKDLKTGKIDFLQKKREVEEVKIKKKLKLWQIIVYGWIAILIIGLVSNFLGIPSYYLLGAALIFYVLWSNDILKIKR